MATPRKSFKTPAGTELPLLSLKGKEYLQVAHRLVWFRETHPTGILKTTMLAMNGEGEKEYAVFKTEVFIGGSMVASGHKKETRGGFDDFIEKAETGSIGRALALAGFGTQFTGDELDEKMRLADSPVDVISTGAGNVAAGVATSPASNSAAAVGNGVASNRRPSFRKNASAVTSNVGDDI